MRHKLYYFLFSGLLFFLFYLTPAKLVRAEGAPPPPPGPMDETAKSLLEKGAKTNYNTDVNQDSLYAIVGKGIEFALSIIGVLLILLIIYAGYLWFAAGGNEEQIATAKSYILNAIIGITIVLLAYAITYFVMLKVTGAVSGVL